MISEVQNKVETMGPKGGVWHLPNHMQGFDCETSPRESIHHPTPKAFSYNVILWSSQTSKAGCLWLPPNPTCAYTTLCTWITNIGRVKSQNTSPAFSKNVCAPITILQQHVSFQILQQQKQFLITKEGKRKEEKGALVRSLYINLIQCKIFPKTDSCPYFLVKFSP